MILADPVTKFMFTLEQKALKKAATKEAFEAILEELKTGFMEEPFKTLNEKSLKGKESLNLKKSLTQVQLLVIYV